MRNGKHGISIAEINRRFHELSESKDDLITRGCSLQDFHKVIAKHKETIVRNLS